MHGILLSCMGCCSSCFLNMLDKLQKWVCRALGPPHTASLESLARRRNVASLSLFHRYYFRRYSSELAKLIRFPQSCGRSICYSNRLHYFSVTVPRCYKDVYEYSFCSRTARFWNSLHAECFPLIYDVNGFKSRVNRHLLSLCSFEKAFLYTFYLA